jgi:hypothetical protein
MLGSLILAPQRDSEALLAIAGLRSSALLARRYYPRIVLQASDNSNSLSAVLFHRVSTIERPSEKLHAGVSHDRIREISTEISGLLDE